MSGDIAISGGMRKCLSALPHFVARTVHVITQYRYRLLIILKQFNSDTYMLYFVVVAKFLKIAIMLRVRTSKFVLVTYIGKG